MKDIQKLLYRVFRIEYQTMKYSKTPAFRWCSDTITSSALCWQPLSSYWSSHFPVWLDYCLRTVVLNLLGGTEPHQFHVRIHWTHSVMAKRGTCHHESYESGVCLVLRRTPETDSLNPWGSIKPTLRTTVLGWRHAAYVSVTLQSCCLSPHRHGHVLLLYRMCVCERESWRERQSCPFSSSSFVSLLQTFELSYVSCCYICHNKGIFFGMVQDTEK